MTKTLWDKYMGKTPTMADIYRDDYIPLVKARLAKGKSIDEGLHEAFESMICQLPFNTVAPIGWICKARNELSV